MGIGHWELGIGNNQQPMYRHAMARLYNNQQPTTEETIAKKESVQPIRTDSEDLIKFKLDIFPHANAEACGLAKIILPAVVCKALVTTTRNSPPT